MKKSKYPYECRIDPPFNSIVEQKKWCEDNLGARNKDTGLWTYSKVQRQAGNPHSEVICACFNFRNAEDLLYFKLAFKVQPDLIWRCLDIYTVVLPLVTDFSRRDERIKWLEEHKQHGFMTIADEATAIRRFRDSCNTADAISTYMIIEYRGKATCKFVFRDADTYTQFNLTFGGVQ